MSELGVRVASGTPECARCSARFVTVKVRTFVFKRQSVARNANQHSRRPQMEAVADIQKLTRYSNSV